MRFIIVLFMGFLSLNLCAKASLPEGCKALMVQGESVTLKPTSKNKLVFIRNNTGSDLWITHPVSDAGASAGWASRIQANHWSALAVDKAAFVLTCIESKPGHEQQVPCEGAIAVCQWKGVKIPGETTSTFWAAEDQPLSELTTTLGGKGFVFPVVKN
jgi:hypothetical protein